MSQSNSTIAINSHDGYRSSLQTLRDLQGQIQTKADDSAAVIDTLTVAASTGVQSDGAATTSTGTVIAPAYNQTLAVTSDAMTRTTALVTAATQSLGNAITKLEELQNALNDTDQTAATNVEQAS